jgi:hypothetical protein
MMRRSYLNIEYMDDTQQPMLSFLSFSLSTENVWNVLCQVPYEEFYIVYSWNVYYYYFWNTHANSSPAMFSIAVRHMDLLLRISGKFFKAPPYSLKHLTIGRTPLDYWSAQLKNLCLTTHNTHNRQIFMPSAGIQPTIPPSQRPQSHFLDRAATGIDNFLVLRVKILSFEKLHTSCNVIILL